MVGMSERRCFLLVSLGVVVILAAAVWRAAFHPFDHENEPVGITMTGTRTVVPPENPSSLEGYIELGQSEAARLRYAEAITALTKAIELDPGRSDTYLERANVYRETGTLDRAVADCNCALQLDLDNVQALTLRGKVRSATGDQDGALADFSDAIELAPDDPSLYRIRATHYRRIGDHSAAIDDLTRVIELDHDSGPGYYLRGGEHVLLEDYPAAAADFREAAAADPDHCWYHVRLAEVYTLMGEHSDAIDEWTEFIALGANETFGRTQRACALCRAERYDEADRDIQLTLAEAPNYAPALLLHAWLAAHRGQEDQARADLTRITTTCTDEPYGNAAREATALLDAQKVDQWEVPADK